MEAWNVCKKRIAFEVVFFLERAVLCRKKKKKGNSYLAALGPGKVVDPWSLEMMPQAAKLEMRVDIHQHISSLQRRNSSDEKRLCLHSAFQTKVLHSNSVR